MVERATYGAGSIKETRPGSGIWRYRQRVDGRQVERTIGSKVEPLTRKQAERAARQVVIESTASVASSSGDGMTVRELLEEWLTYGRTARGQRWAPKTAYDNRREVERRINPTLGHIRLRDLSARDLERAYELWGKTVSDSTVHRSAALLSSALTFALRRDYIDANPSTKAVAPAQSRPRRKLPTADEVSRMIEAGEKWGHDMGKAIALAALTGARAGEVCALQWADVDLKRGRVRIHRSVTEVEGKIILKTTKTDSEHTARIEGPNLTRLKAVLGKPGPTDTFVIDGGTKPVNPGVISDRFVCVRGKAKVRGVTFHSLRGYWATAMLAAGVPVHVVARAGGWRTERMLLERYGQDTPSGFDQAAAVELLPPTG